MKVRYALITVNHNKYSTKITTIIFDTEKQADYFLEKKKSFYEQQGYEVIQLMDGVYSISALKTTIRVEPVDETEKILPRYVSVV